MEPLVYLQECQRQTLNTNFAVASTEGTPLRSPQDLVPGDQLTVLLQDRPTPVGRQTHGGTVPNKKCRSAGL
jgi:hypothetical protein